MDDDYLTIEPGDRFAVELDADGFPAIKIANSAFDDAPRWLLFKFPGGDQATRIAELIDALTELRDETAKR